MKNIWRYTGYILAGLGALHTVVFAVLCAEGFVEILSAGFFDSIGFNSGRALTWYGGVWLGVIMILFGCFAQSWIRATARPLPCYLGWTLAAIGLIGTILQPASGASLVCLLGLLIVFVRPS